jgi:AraC-like DNA-binding protein
MISSELEQAQPDQDSHETVSSDSKMRLQLFLKQTPSSELLEMNFSELAQRTHCSSRHLGRIFHEMVGMSFGEKRAELRLERARELLATTNSKIVDVALESGYKSLSLFNMMFGRRFGISPGKWRQKHENGEKNGRTKKLKIPAPEINKSMPSLRINVSASPAEDRRQKRGKTVKKSNAKSLARRNGDRVSILQK